MMVIPQEQPKDPITFPPGETPDNYYRPMRHLKRGVRARIPAWLVEKHDRKCHWCGVQMDLLQMTKDHLIPKSKGGTNCRENLVLSCKSCNEEKADMMPDEYKAQQTPGS